MLVWCGICSYRSPDEIKEVRKTRDPILMLQNRMIESNVSTADELKVSIRKFCGFNYLFTIF